MKLKEIEMRAKARNNKHLLSLRQKLSAYDTDKNHLERKHEKFICKYCEYIDTPRIGGSAMTRANCLSCEEDMLFASTNTDVLCLHCAQVLRRCKHCGQMLD